MWDSCKILRFHDGHCPLVNICNGLASKGYVIGYVGEKNNLSLDEVEYVAFGIITRMEDSTDSSWELQELYVGHLFKSVIQNGDCAVSK